METELSKISIVIHNVMTKSNITNMSALTKKSFSRKEHENIKLMNHKKTLLIT
jgi:hypothetical protein